LEPSVTRFDDVIWIGFPDKELSVSGIVFSDEAIDGGLQVGEGMEDAVLEPAPRDLQSDLPRHRCPSH